MGNAVDYAWARPSLDVLWNAGVRTVGRYIGPSGWGKTIEQPEYDALVAKFGRDNVFGVFEIGNDDSSGGFDAGVNNARTALQFLPAGYPEEMAIFLAADEELEGAALDAAIEYFHGGSTVIAPERLGAYSQGTLLAACKAAGWIGHTWLSGSTSFPGYAQEKAIADIVQGLDGPGGGTDDDTVLRPLISSPIPVPTNKEDTMVGVSPIVKTDDGVQHRAAIVFPGVLCHTWVDSTDVPQHEFPAARAGNEAEPPSAPVAGLTFDANQVPTCQVEDGVLILGAQTVLGGTVFEFLQGDKATWNCRQAI